MTDRDIVGTAVGLTINGEPAIKVFTKSESIMRIPQQLDGIPVEAEATGGFYALTRLEGDAPTRARNNPAKFVGRPVPIGVSTGNAGDCSSGTIAARVMDGGEVFILSNNHVLALENTAPINSDILQPGLANVKCVPIANSIIGKLSAFVPIVFSTSANNTVDAAIAASDVSLLGNATLKKGYGTPQSTIVAAFVDQEVQKNGARSKRTKGKVTAINATILVEYDSGTARFVDQIIVGSSRPFIRAGDSGSLLVTRPGAEPVGLLFAGAKGGRIAIANRIGLVLNALGVSIDGE